METRLLIPEYLDSGFDRQLRAEEARLRSSYQKWNLKYDDAIKAIWITPFEKVGLIYESLVGMYFEKAPQRSVILPGEDPEAETQEVAFRCQIMSSYFETQLKKGRKDKLGRKMRDVHLRTATKLLSVFPDVCVMLDNGGERVSRFLRPEDAKPG